MLRQEQRLAFSLPAESRTQACNPTSPSSQPGSCLTSQFQKQRSRGLTELTCPWRLFETQLEIQFPKCNSIQCFSWNIRWQTLSNVAISSHNICLHLNPLCSKGRVR